MKARMYFPLLALDALLSDSRSMLCLGIQRMAVHRVVAPPNPAPHPAPELQLRRLNGLPLVGCRSRCTYSCHRCDRWFLYPN